MLKFKDNGPCTNVYGKTLLGYHLSHGVEHESPKTFLSRNPAYQPDIVGEFPLATLAQVEDACRQAGNAYQHWQHTPAPIRGQIIGNLGRLLAEHKAELARLVTREIGKTYEESLGEVQEMIATAQFFQTEGHLLYGQTIPSETPHKECLTYRRPLGVAALITACNFPLAVPSGKIIPALLCGNTVVWKPSEEAPTVADIFGRLLTEAGLPPGVVNIVYGPGRTGQDLMAMVDKGLVQKVSFTGSTAVGRQIGEICGRNLISPSLELGGKNPLIIMADANIELAVKAALWLAFGTAGQRCTSTGNIILHKKIAAAFRQKFLAGAQSLKIGDPTLSREVYYGPLMCEKYFTDFMNHFEWAKAEGAKLLYGNGRITRDSKPQRFVGDPEAGFYVWPVIWDQVHIDMKIAQTEVLGPCITLIEVNDLDEALAVANGTPYGLSSAMYTQNMFYASRFKNEIQAGMSSINNATTGGDAPLRFGGTKASGNSTRESGIWVLDAYTRWQAINQDSNGRLHMAQGDTEYVTSSRVKTSLKILLPKD